MEGSLRVQGKQRWRPGGLDEPRSVGLSLPCAGPVKTRALLPSCHFHPTAQRKCSFLYSVHQNLTQRPCAALSHPCPQVTALTWKTSPGLPSGRAWEHLDGLISETPNPAPSLQAPRVVVVSLCQGPCPLHPQRVAWISSCLSTETLGCPGSSACFRHQTSVVCKVHGGCGDKYPQLTPAAVPGPLLPSTCPRHPQQPRAVSVHSGFLVPAQGVAPP